MDNDCDGSIDEEVRDGKDNDGDGATDEDTELVRYQLKHHLIVLSWKSLKSSNVFSIF